MKSYVLERITSSREEVRTLLGTILPGQENPWLLLDNGGNPVAYFDFSETDIDIREPAVIADISGRHYNEDEKVVAVLRRLQTVVGGTITYAP